MEYLDNECKFCGGEIINDPDTGNKICKHCGAEFFDKSKKSSTSILGRFNIQNQPVAQTQSVVQNQPVQTAQAQQPERELTALEKWELEHSQKGSKFTSSTSKFPLIKLPMWLRYASAIIMYFQIFCCFLAGIIVAFTAGENAHGMTEIFAIFSVIPISLIIWGLFVGPMPSQGLKKASKITIITLTAMCVITIISMAVAFGIYNAQSGDDGGRSGYTFEYEIHYEGDTYSYYSDSEGYLHIYHNGEYMYGGKNMEEVAIAIYKSSNERFYGADNEIVMYNSSQRTMSYFADSEGCSLDITLINYDEHSRIAYFGFSSGNNYYQIKFDYHYSDIDIYCNGHEIDYFRNVDGDFIAEIDGQEVTVVYLSDPQLLDF